MFPWEEDETDENMLSKVKVLKDRLELNLLKVEESETMQKFSAFVNKHKKEVKINVKNSGKSVG